MNLRPTVCWFKTVGKTLPPQAPAERLLLYLSAGVFHNFTAASFRPKIDRRQQTKSMRCINIDLNSKMSTFKARVSPDRSAIDGSTK
ncbi:MAG TPA: hypothetical protein DEW97_07855 [Sutterella wadsworthensis]|jgi:hypothetical protein|nr:MAG: hypothetical protein BHW60_07530 [Sutterella sp. 54_7]HCE88010.1 hypothetical protein [Sutterella wadsworthensis]HCG93490.1 hypothetical protein [Sutterella wadsworthensis]